MSVKRTHISLRDCALIYQLYRKQKTWKEISTIIHEKTSHYFTPKECQQVVQTILPREVLSHFSGIGTNEERLRQQLLQDIVKRVLKDRWGGYLSLDSTSTKIHDYQKPNPLLKGIFNEKHTDLCDWSN